MFTYHVSKTGSDFNPGTEERPFKTISKAAAIADFGDTVIVHEGVYREWVKPMNSGLPLHRITYKSANGEHVVIKGSERISSWINDGGSVWKAEIPNDIFVDGNPFATVLKGDWLVFPSAYEVHTAAVYLNGKALYEAPSIDEVRKPSLRTWTFNPPITKREERIRDIDSTIYTWFAVVEDYKTTVWANFQGFDPNAELVEINVRPSVFFPTRTGINYITVDGFELAQAATYWAPPTGDQPGIIGPHWAKGWIIENCDIHDSKCSAVSIGKEVSTGDNECTKYHRKPGYHYQMEVVFRALENGWSKEKIGGHIIRNNRIHDNGQNGIVGHLGCVFSEIYGNEIWNTGIMHEFIGAEIAGIKLHAALDVQIRNNFIHDSILGIWLDWQTQGTRVSRNVFLDNDRDIYIEVSHGPYILDNNIFGSEYNFDNFSQGGAIINNLMCGTMKREAVLNRSTPYHFAHSTKVAGTSFVYSGDDRIYQNIYIGGAPKYHPNCKSGTIDYNGCPSSMEEYKKIVVATGNGDHNMYLTLKDPVYIGNNGYFNGAKNYDKETDPFVSDFNPDVRFISEGNQLYIEFDANEQLISKQTDIIRSWSFEPPRITECRFDTPSGDEIIFDWDINGNQRSESSPIGPFASLVKGHNRIKIWG